MAENAVDIRILDAAYQPFPSFEEWLEKTAIETIRWNRYQQALSSYNTLTPNQLNRAREIAKRAAAIDTGALEDLYEVDRGFTFTIAFEAASWEVALAKQGEQVRPLFEAQLHAYDYVLDLATRAEPISEASIRALHEVVCHAQETYLVMTAIGPQEQPLPKGQYKSLPNHVRTRKGDSHSYAPVDMTPMEMARLVEELRSEAFLNAHPVQQAAYAHYAFVLIHPFADGNGRVARALASAFTYRAVSTPIVILMEHKVTYLDSLESADAGNYQAFNDFILNRSLETLQLVEESLKSSELPPTDEILKAMEDLYFTRGGYTAEDINLAGLAFLNLLHKYLQKSFASFKKPKLNGSANIGNYGLPGMMVDRETHRLGNGLQLILSLQPPVKASITKTFQLWIPLNADGSDDMVLKSGRDIVFSARIDEILPSVSGPLEIRAGMFGERVVREALAELLDIARNSARSF